jgi:NAD(P)-dependent dehydrogenase (short-subunit alcohol dehydrogenase family)
MDFDNLFSLAGRTAIVTGGSRGIGRMIAEGFVRSGVRTYITARKADACDRAAKELSELGHCVSIPADVSSTTGITDFVTAFREHESSLDILVNNAGAAWAEPFDEFSESGWDKVMDLNVKTPFFLTQALKAELVAASTDHVAKVINIASIDGISLNPLETYSYHASKSGLIQLTRRMGVRLIEDGIAEASRAPPAATTAR